MLAYGGDVSVARWVAQWKEMIEDPRQKIGRPRYSLQLPVSCVLSAAASLECPYVLWCLCVCMRVCVRAGGEGSVGRHTPHPCMRTYIRICVSRQLYQGEVERPFLRIEER